MEGPLPDRSFCAELLNDQRQIIYEIMLGVSRDRKGQLSYCGGCDEKDNHTDQGCCHSTDHRPKSVFRKEQKHQSADSPYQDRQSEPLPCILDFDISTEAIQVEQNHG